MHSSFDIEVVPTQLINFIIIEEIKDNPGMSITNGAEFFCVQIAERLDLPFRRCRFLEKYPPDDLNPDVTFDLINFAPDSIVSDGFFKKAQLIRWQAVPLDLARQLHECGLELSLHIGKTGIFRYQKKDHEYRIDFSNGRSYYHNDQLIPGRLVRIK